MAVQAPDRPAISAKSPARDGVEGWLCRLREHLDDHAWIGLYAFEEDASLPPRLYCYAGEEKAPLAAMLVAKKAQGSGRFVTVRLGQTHRNTAGEHKPGMTLTAVPLPEKQNLMLVLYSHEQSPEQQSRTIKLCCQASRALGLKTPQANSGGTSKGASDSLADAVLNTFYEQPTPEAIALAIVNTLKQLCGCQRVSLAVRRSAQASRSLELLAVSDQARIDCRKVLPMQLNAAMHETLSSNGHVCLSSANLDHLEADFPAMATLFRDQGEYPALALSHPVNSEAAAMTCSHKVRWSQAVVLLERPTGQSFTDAQQQAIKALITPSLDLLVRLCDEQRPPWQRLLQRLQSYVDGRFWLGKVMARPGISLMLLVGLSTLIVPMEHKFSAKAAIEARDLQVLIAPQNGFVATAHARSGDRVVKGQLLAGLDTQDLQLAMNKWQSEAAKNSQALDIALATGDRVAIGRLRADAARIAAEQALVEHQLSRAELRAPFDGVVLSGDLSQKLGAAVVQGDTLFTIAASNEYRLVLDIKEQDVGLVQPGQVAQVRLSAIPDRTWQVSLESVLPVATSTPDANVFRVPAEFSEFADVLLPGMEGVARIDAGSHSIAWVYTRTLREKLRVLLWRMGLLR